MTMVSKAVGKYLPVTPRKVRSVVRLIKGLEVTQAEEILKTLPRGASKTVFKVLHSAIANATVGGTWTKEQLVISRIMTDGGPTTKRFRAAAMGRAVQIQKHKSHLTIELDVKK